MFIMATSLSLRFIAKLHDSSSNVSRIEYVIFLVKEKDVSYISDNFIFVYIA